MHQVALSDCFDYQRQVAHRPYHPVTVDALASGTVIHTHVRVTGRVRLIRLEQDGDMHYKLTGARAFIVAECIPELPCMAPGTTVKLGDRVTVEGISRRDAEHKWWEVHPVEHLEVERGARASAPR